MKTTIAPSAHSLQKQELLPHILRALQPHLPSHALLYQTEDTTPYECDGLTAYRQRPLLVALPETEAQVAAVLRACHVLNVPVVARGAGTGLSGGAMPHALGVTLSLAKFNKIVKIDKRSRTAVVQCGVRNLAISEAASPYGLYYAPDPSSQIACTIGGNVAENSGGVHCLKYGLTLHNVLKVRGFTMEGEPIYDIYPIGKRFQGWEKTKLYYRHFFAVVQPAIQNFTPVSQAIGEKGVVEEYDIVVLHPGESTTTTHRIIAILTFGEERLSGERMYSDDKLFKLMFGPLWDSLEPIPSV